MARLGIDIGGTFTDFALEVSDAGRVRQHFVKVLTTPESPEIAVIEGIRRVLAQAGIGPEALTQVVHGTTLATNAVIERRGARIAFITTEGLRDTLEMGTESRYDHDDLNIGKPEPLVPRHLRLVVSERLAADGRVLRPLDEAGLRALLPTLDDAGVEAVAIGFLHSFVNAAHERRAAELLGAWRPLWRVSISSDVAPEIREHERFCTTCVNAYVQPDIAGYLERLEGAMRQLGIPAPLLLILSNGGLCDVDVARRFPVRLLESGPAGGAILAADVARRLGLERALMLDIGGTTAKLCFIDDGVAETSRTMEVARIARFKAGSGIPLRFPVIELAEIGAGGGSIAHLDALGRLQVGPASAGSVPGPACYARGGAEPTITDAHLLLGRLEPQAFAGGHMTLDVAAARAAYDRLGRAMGLSAEDTAWSVCEVIDENMASAVREHAVEVGKGVDGRTLIAIGGMAALHAACLAAKLGLDRVVIPTGAGVGSALGFLCAPIAFEGTRSVMLRAARLDVDVANAQMNVLIDDLHDLVRRAAPGLATQVQRTAWMRYQGQGHEIRVPLPERAFEAGDAGLLQRAFESAYHARYGRTLKRAAAEVLGWTVRVEALAVPATTQQPAPTPSARSAAPRAVAHARMLDQRRRRWCDAAVHAVDEVARVHDMPGPVLLRTDETTIVVPLGFCSARGDGGEVSLHRRSTSRDEVEDPSAPTAVRYRCSGVA